MEGWLVLDGYEDEPAAFGVPNYLGFHIRYICGVLESRSIPYTYMTIDEWRLFHKQKLANSSERQELQRELSELDGAVVLKHHLRQLRLVLVGHEHTAVDAQPVLAIASDLGHDSGRTGQALTRQTC